MSDLGLEDVERLVDEDNKEKKNKKDRKDKKRRSYSRSRSHDRKKKKDRKFKEHKKNRSRSRSKISTTSKHIKKDRKKDKKDKREKKEFKFNESREREEEEQQHHPIPHKPNNSGPEIIDKSYFDKNEESRKKNEVKMIKDQLIEAQKLEEEARREDNTVIISSLPLACNEKEIYKYFSKCGKIRDVYLIRDQRSGKSKGIAYVEFYYPDSIITACTQHNKELNGHTIQIQPSHAEKNRVAQAAKNLKQKQAVPVPSATNAATNAKRIYISNLTDTLADITENNLKNVFSPFGDVELVDIHRDPYTGKCKGYAFIQYIRQEDAKAAINKMNGYIIAGRPIKVTAVTQELSQLCDANAVDLDDEGTSHYIHTPQSRALLIQKLSRTDNTFAAGILAAPGHPDHLQNPEMVSIINAISTLPTTCLFLAGMFDLKDVNLVKDSNFIEDLGIEIKTECCGYGKVVEVWIDTVCEVNAWILFENVGDCINAYERLRNRFFNKKKINANYMSEEFCRKRFFGEGLGYE